jgi:hypothetical protein
LHKNK